MSKGKLYYFYSTMNSGKSSTLILKEYQFRQSGSTTFVMKPSIDTRSNETIKSRAIVNELPCYVFDKDKDLFKFVFSLIGQTLIQSHELNDICVFVDEANFLTKEQVQQLFELTRSRYNIKVFCYGLKNTYKNELFESSERLLALADKVEEIKSKCSTKHCENKATTHIRYVDGKPFLEGESINVGDVNADDDYYSSVCQSCFHEITNSYKHIDRKSVV